MRADVTEVVVSDTADRLAALAGAVDDVQAAGVVVQSSRRHRVDRVPGHRPPLPRRGLTPPPHEFWPRVHDPGVVNHGARSERGSVVSRPGPQTWGRCDMQMIEARSFMADQHGLLTSAQAHGLGLTTDDIAHRVERGEWVRRAAPSARLAVGSPDLAVAAPAAPRARCGGRFGPVAHDRTRPLGARGFVAEPVHVIRHRDHLDHKAHGAVLQGEVRYLPLGPDPRPRWHPPRPALLGVAQLAGMPLPSGTAGPGDRCGFWADRLVTHATLTAVDRRMSPPGPTRSPRGSRAGRGAWSGVRATRRRTSKSRFAQILVDAGRPPMRRQVDSGSGAVGSDEVDFRADECPPHRGGAERAVPPRAAGRAGRPPSGSARLEQAGFVVVPDRRASTCFNDRRT